MRRFRRQLGFLAAGCLLWLPGLAAAQTDAAGPALAAVEHCSDDTCRFSALTAALQAEPRSVALRVRLAGYYLGRHQLEKAAALLDEALRQAPGDRAARNGRAELLLARGRPQAALDIWQSLAADPQCPDSLRRQLARRYLEFGLADRAEPLLKTLATVDAGDPEVQSLRQMLYRQRRDATGLASLDPPTAAAPRAAPVANALETEYLADATALAAAVRSKLPVEVGSAVRLAEIRIDHLTENGLATRRQQQVVYLASSQGVRDFSAVKLQYSPATEQLRVLTARVYKADGRMLEGETGEESAVFDAAAAMYYDTRARTVRFPALEKGDVVELDYRITPLGTVNPYGDYFGTIVPFANRLAQQLQRYVLIAPAGRHLNIVTDRLAQPSINEAGRERIYCWEARTTPALVNEPKGPALTEAAAYVHVSTFQSWDELGRWYAALVAPQFALDDALRRKAAELTAGARTEVERIAAIHQFVLRNTHYLAMEFGVYNYKPYPVSQVYGRRFGDCKDKAALMIALLREAGIRADMALVRTRRLGTVSPRATSVALFNHAIVYLPDYDLWLDGTAEYAGLHELPLDDQGAMALTVAVDGQATLRRIPVTEPEDNYVRRQVRARLLADGRIEFQGTAYTRGEDAPGLRREYETAERQRDAVRNSLADIFPAVRLEQVQVNGADDLERPVTVDFRGRVDNFAGRITVPLAPSWLPRGYVQQLAPLAARSSDLLLPAPWTTEEELHFELPAGAAILTAPVDTVLDTPYGSARLRFERTGRELVVRTSVQFRQLRITPDQYAGFRDFCLQLERAFRGEIRIGLGG